jgi:folate-binding protein YgfZ
MIVQRNFGDPAAEYAAARTACVVIDRTDRRIIRVYGRDPVRMVQGLVSNDVAAAGADRVVYATVLTPKGRMVADTRVLRHGADLLLDTDAEAADGLAAHLRKFVPPLFARFEDATPAWSMTGVYGPLAADRVRDVFDVDVVPDAEDDAVTTTFDDVPVTIITTSYAGVSGFDILVPSDAGIVVRRGLIAAGAVQAGHATLDVLRIEAGQPKWGAELDETTIPLEAGLRRRAISETKGCYTGQEVIIRILHRGHVNWVLRGVLLGDTATPVRGAPLVREPDGKQVGRITSAAWSPQHGQTIALAYVRREVEPGAALRLETLDGRSATVVELPFPTT